MKEPKNKFELIKSKRSLNTWSKEGKLKTQSFIQQIILFKNSQWNNSIIPMIPTIMGSTALILVLN